MSDWGGGGGGSNLVTGTSLFSLMLVTCFWGEVGDLSEDGDDGFALLTGSGGREEFGEADGEVAAVPGRVELRLRGLIF